MKQWIAFVVMGEPIGKGAMIERSPFTEGYPVYSRVLVCPMCKQVWAMLTAEGKPVHRPEMASCGSCDWQSPDSPVPGSLLVYGIPTSNVDYSLLDVLPEEFLRREFNLTLKALA
jgi:hypothetical protein